MAEDKKQAMTVGFIGLGRMGLGMASNLCRKGFSLVVYDITPQAVHALLKLGAKSADSIAKAPKDVDVIITMLPNSAIVHEPSVGRMAYWLTHVPGQLLWT